MKTFPLQIVTPEGSFFDGEAQMIRLRTIDGDIHLFTDSKKVRCKRALRKSVRGEQRRNVLRKLGS